MTKKEYRHTVWDCRNVIRKAEGAESDEWFEQVRESLLQVPQQHKKDQGICGPTAEVDRGPGEQWESLEQGDLPWLKEDSVREHLSKLDIHDPLGPNGSYPQALRELDGPIVGQFSITSERPRWLGKVPWWLEKKNVIPILNKKVDMGRKFGVVNMDLWRGNHAWSNWQTSTKKITSSMDNVRTVDIVYHDFSSAFDTIFHVTLTVKQLNRTR